MRTSSVIVMLFWVLGTSPAMATNLDTCLSGKYPALCNKSVLTPDQLKNVAVAEHRENLNTCLQGKYLALCRHAELSNEEAESVSVAEHRENLAMCLQGKHPALCRHGDLASQDRNRAYQAEKVANLQTCLQGYSALCRHELLSKDEALRAANAEAERAATMAVSARATRRGVHSRGGCESGHWVDAVMKDGEIVKLEDGSIWEIQGGDSIDTALWLPLTEIVACDDKLINTDDNETVDAVRIH